MTTQTVWVTLGTVGVDAILTLAALHWVTAWVHRGITAARSWTVTILTAATLAGAAGAAAHHWAAAPAAVTVAVTALAWLSTVAVSTDLSSRMIPREITHLTAVAGLVAFATQYTAAGLIHLLVAAVALVAIPWTARTVTNKGLGFGDVRLLGAVTATLAWWVDPAALMWALVGAAVLQGVAHTVTHVVAATPTAGRHELPFAPALVAAFTAAATLTLTALT